MRPETPATPKGRTMLGRVETCSDLAPEDCYVEQVLLEMTAGAGGNGLVRSARAVGELPSKQSLRMH